MKLSEDFEKLLILSVSKKYNIPYEEAEKIVMPILAKKDKIEEYKNFRLFDRCRIIALKIGKQFPKSHGAWWIYKDDEITIAYDDYAPNIYVDYRGTRVLTVHLGDLECFKPGKWLHKVEKLSEPLFMEEREKELEDRRGELFNELYKWQEVIE